MNEGRKVQRSSSIGADQTQCEREKVETASCIPGFQVFIVAELGDLQPDHNTRMQQKSFLAQPEDVLIEA